MQDINFSTLNDNELLDIAEMFADSYSAYNFARTLHLANEIRNHFQNGSTTLIIGGNDVAEYFDEVGVLYDRYGDSGMDDYFIFDEGLEVEDEFEFEGWVYTSNCWEARVEYAEKMLSSKLGDQHVSKAA